jgi:flagellar biosynthesis protein FlhB
MSDDRASKTEEPTSRRLEDAREKGQVAQSREINNLIMMSAMLVVILLIAPVMTQDVMSVLRRFVETPHLMHIDDGNFHDLMASTTSALAAGVIPSLLLLLAAAFLPSLLQHGFLWTTYNLSPRLDRISPLRGIARFFSLRNLVELVKGIVKMAIVGTVAAIILMPVLGWVEHFITGDVSLLAPAIVSLTVKLLAGVITVMVLLAGLDYVYQKHEYIKSLRMTKQEVKDEFKQLEGDPTIKGKLKQIRNQRAKARMMQAVPTATVVVTNPTHYAVALKYEQAMNAPVLVAKGIELLALRIIEKARENFIPVVENPPLARTLFATVEVDEEIPREHYKAVAEVVGYVMRLRKRVFR